MAIIRDPVPTEEIVTMSRDLESLFVVMLEEILSNLEETPDSESIDIFINNALSVLDK